MAKVKTGPKTRKKIGGPRPAEGGPRADKVAAVATIKERFTTGPVLLTEYRGLTVAEMKELRRALAGGAELKVFKNTLATIAAREAGLEELIPMLLGPTAIAFVTGDVAKVAKDLADFAKKAPALTIKGGIFEGAVLSGDQAKKLSTLESREVMLTKIAGMAVSPLQRAANAFAAGFNQLGAVLAQHRDKLAASEAA
ncbi:MAG: 50S ribosomal protein L10 [Actinomycetota bacterium]